ncbi:MAG: hypothetical protein KAR06_10530 [Deltaproteobacteria bacterium]|nr:hypothetical protein [Deltaproteobacteria bacterium]
MKLKIAVTLIVFVVSASSCFAASDGAKSRSGLFLEGIKAGKVEAAYDKILKGSPMNMIQPQSVVMLKQQTATILSFFGKVIGYELIHEESYGSSFVELVYIMKLEDAPIFWKFYFYKPNKEWFVTGVTFNTDPDLLKTAE